MMTKLRFRAWIGLAAATLVTMSSLPLSASASAATATPAPQCPVIDSSGQHHCHVEAERSWSTPTIDGVGGLFTEPDVMPQVKSGDYSIGQLSLASSTVNFFKAVEFGWIVAPAVYRDQFPHLFIALRFTNNLGRPVLCFIGVPKNTACPKYIILPVSRQKILLYQQLSSTNHPGMAVGYPLGHGNATPIMYHVGYYNHAWWIQYGNQWMGTVSAYYWGGDPTVNTDGFSKGTTADWFGEISYTGKRYCTTTMGDEWYGSRSNAATVTSMFYEEPNGHSYPANATINEDVDSAKKSVQAINAKYWDSNKKPGQKFSSFRYGGPFGGPNSC
jgi:hypothetical protein